MTNRERMLAVLQGRPHDRVPLVQYTNIAAPNPQVWDLLGRDRLGTLTWTAAAGFHAPNCRFVTEEFAHQGRQGYRTTLHTPAGALQQEKLLEPVFGSAATHRFYVREPRDYLVLLAYLNDLVISPNLTGTASALEAIGEDGLLHFNVRRTPFQQLWVEWVSLTDLCLHMVDAPDLMAEVYETMRRVQRQTFAAAIEVARQLPVPYIVFPDNITAPAIGPHWFAEHCLGSYRELADMVAEAGLNLPIHCHMDGDLRPLWDQITASPVRGIDSLSPPPDNDTTVTAALALAPDMRVFPNFPSSVHLAPAADIQRTAAALLQEGGASGRFWIQISENVPPDRWQVSYPAIAQAIDEFGVPVA
ncbi:MAG: hypothetical protein HUU35_06005 [Armatimonadetes bacterium]|nr:hypothetical protein [Armatimonadota bacterium]